MRTLADIKSDLATPDEVATVTPFTRQTIQRMLRRGEIPGTKWGGRWFVNVPRLSLMLDGNLVPGPSSGSAATPGPGDLSTTGSSSEATPLASPSAGARPAGPGGGATSAARPAGGGPCHPAASPVGGARSGGSPSPEQRSA